MSRRKAELPERRPAVESRSRHSLPHLRLFYVLGAGRFKSASSISSGVPIHPCSSSLPSSRRLRTVPTKRAGARSAAPRPIRHWADSPSSGCGATSEIPRPPEAPTPQAARFPLLSSMSGVRRVRPVTIAAFSPPSPALRPTSPCTSCPRLLRSSPTTPWPNPETPRSQPSSRTLRRSRHIAVSSVHRPRGPLPFL